MIKTILVLLIMCIAATTAFAEILWEDPNPEKSRNLVLVRDVICDNCGISMHSKGSCSGVVFFEVKIITHVHALSYSDPEHYCRTCVESGGII